MARRRKQHAVVKEPVQVYLDGLDQELLERLRRQTGDSKAELLRRGLRSLARAVLKERPPGWTFDALSGLLGDDPSIPRDLAQNHDQYLYQAMEEDLKRGRKGLR